MKIGVFGGCFDPPTRGHQDVIAQALAAFDQIIIVPTRAHPFGKPLTPFHHRLAMLKLMLQDFPPEQSKKIIIHDIEAKLLAAQKQPGPVYTYDVLKALREESDAPLHFIVGPDNADKKIWQKFYRYQDIEKNWPLFVAKAHQAIRSTLVRDCVRQYHDDPKALNQALSQAVVPTVLNYIIAHQLYSGQQASSKNQEVTFPISLDIAIFTLIDNQLHVLLVPMLHGPFQGKNALAVTYIDALMEKDLNDAVKRKIQQLVSTKAAYIEQVETKGNDSRDPRGWSVSILYNALVVPPLDAKVHPLWVPLDKALKSALAFDHKLALSTAYKRLQNKALYTSLPLHLLPDEFTLSDCQKAYESVLGFELEKKSFRRRFLEAALFEETGNIRKANYRPAQLYRLKPLKEPYYFPRVLEGKREVAT